MIGFYNYTVILTYMSLVSSIIGMTLAHAGKFGAAVFCLALSGFFDMFDGKLPAGKQTAQTMKSCLAFSLTLSAMWSRSVRFRLFCATAWA